MPKQITSADQAITLLGGTYAVAALFDPPPEPRVVSNWRTRGLPPSTLDVLGPLLRKAKCRFPPTLFGQRVAARTRKGKGNGTAGASRP